MTDAGPHPDLDTLADLDAGLLEDRDSARLHQHVAGCAACQGALGTLAETRATLRALPPVAMPQEVADRLDAALAAARSSAPANADTMPTAVTVPTAADIVPMRRRRRPGTGPGLAGAAAAAAVVLLLAGIVAGALRASHDTAGKAGTSNAAAPNPALTQRYVETVSGRNYTASTVPGAVSSLLGLSANTSMRDSAIAGEKSAAGAHTPAPAGVSGSPALSPAQSVPEPLSRLKAQPLALFDCITALTGQATPLTVPLAVDFARFDNKPAVVIVLPTPGNPSKADVWVVGPGCSSKDDQTRYFARVPR